MASRQAGFFVRHTEKLIFAAAVAFSLLLVGIAWAGVFGSPASTRVGSDTVTPSNVQAVVKAEADKLRIALDASEPGVPDVTIPTYSDEFAARIAASLLPEGKNRLIAPIGPSGLPREAFALQATNHPTYRLPSPPMVTKTVVKVDNAVLANPGDIPDPLERELVADLSRRLGLQPGSPGDFQYVSVMAQFPLAEWAKLLEQPDPSAVNQNIPANVWRPRLALGGVYLLRQQLDERSGTWGQAERVTALSNQLAYLPGEPSNAESLLEAEAIVAELQTRQEDVARASFPPTRHVAWSPPTGRDRVFGAEEQAELEALENTIRDLESQLARLSNREEPSERPGRGRRELPGRAGGGGGGAFDLGDLEDGPTPSRGPLPDPRSRGTRGGREEAVDPDQRRLQRIQDELGEARAQLVEILGAEAAAASQPSLESNNFDGGSFDVDFGDLDDSPSPAGGPGGFGGPFGGVGPGRSLRGSVDEVAESVVVWSHDLTAKAGATYRYKLVAAPLNPLFRYSRVSEEQRQANRERVTLGPSEADLNAAPWSPAVTLNPEAEFFFLGGNADQDRARVEVWKIHDGLWQTAEFEENSGNGIGGSQILDVRGQRERVDLGTGSLLLDIDVQPGIDSNPDQRLVYETPEGLIRSRTRQQDTDSERRKKLQAELETQKLSAAAPL